MESIERTNCHLQETLSKIIFRFLIRNLEGQQAVGWYSPSSDSKNIANQEFNI